MQALIAQSPGRLAWEEVPDPGPPGRAGALVRPVAVTTCDFDHLVVRGATAAQLPLAIGHECVAEVLEVGGDVARVRPGDRVVVPFQVSCGACAPCHAGRTNSCERMPWLSSFGLGALAGDFGGTMADLLSVPYADAMLVPLPAGVTLADGAACACNITDAHRCVAPGLARHTGAPVLVVGGGFDNIALYSARIAATLGAERVDVSGLPDAAAAKARALGARVVDLADVEPAAYPVTVVCSADAAGLELALRATAADGICTASMMYPAERTPLPLMELFARQLTFTTGQPHVRGGLDEVLALVGTGTLGLEPVIDGTVGWDEAPAAFASGAGKWLVTR